MPEAVLCGATYDDLLKVPDHLVAEIVEGELFTSPRPAVPHGHTSLALAARLFSFGAGPGGWWILIEPELHLGSDVLVPDIAGWRRQRVPYLPQTAAIEIAPDWICEVVSPATGGLDRLRKLPRYAETVHAEPFESAALELGNLWLPTPPSPQS
jgi:Uma2 family endonuclease